MKVLCKKCGESLDGNTNYEIRMCRCGALAVDGGPAYTRIIADEGDFEPIGGEIMKYRYIARSSQGGRTENQDIKFPEEVKIHKKTQRKLEG